MSKSRRIVSTTLVVCALAAALPAFSAEGRIPVFAPSVLGVDGKYIVTRNIVGTGAAPVINITAPNVDLDLNGFTLTEPAGAFAVVLVSAASEVRVHNGTLVAGNASVDVAAAAGRKLILEDLRSQDAVGVAPGALHAMGIDNVVIRRCVVVGAPGMTGITVDGPGVHSGTIEKNVVRGTNAGINVLNASAMSVVENAIEGTTAGGGGFGISLMGAGNIIALNTIQDADGTGIDIRPPSRGNKLYNNTVFSAGGNGINMVTGPGLPNSNHLILDNVVTSSTANGLLIGGAQNKVENNVLNENGGCGLVFTGAAAVGNTFGRNMARANLGGAVCPAAACPPLFFPDSCDAGGAGNNTYGDNLIPGPPVF
jgi:parallel beta helix pectate lyase-like protein